nr:hypothetical protein [Gammaproteobacteria bacterium]
MPLAVDTLREDLDDSKFSEFQDLLRSLNLTTLMQAPPGEVTPFIQQVMEGGQAWATDSPASDEAVNAFQAVVALMDAMKASSATTFSEFIDDIRQDNSEVYETYQVLEAELFPGLGFDGPDIFAVMKKNGQSDLITRFIPPQFRPYQEAMEQVKGTPASNFLAPLFAYALGFAPYILGGVVARELTQITSFQRMMLAAAPTALGGGLRFWAAQKVDEGQGKEAISPLLTLSLCGLVGILYFVKTSDVPNIQANDLEYWGLLFANMLSGAGIATFSAAMPMCARSAPNDTVEESNARYQAMTGSEPSRSWMSQVFRKGPSDLMAFVAGIGGLTPTVALLAASSAVPSLGLGETYAIFGAVTLAGQLGLNKCLHNLVLDQLREQAVPEDIAKDIAYWMGQKQQVDPTQTLFQRLNALDSRQVKALVTMCASYVATFGILMALTSTATVELQERGESKTVAPEITAAVSALSTSVRSVMPIPKWPVDSSTITNTALASMAVSLLVFAIAEEKAEWLPVLFVFAIANGAGNYGVFAQITDDLSEV